MKLQSIVRTPCSAVHIAWPAAKHKESQLQTNTLPNAHSHIHTRTHVHTYIHIHTEVEVKLSYPPLFELPARVTPHGATLDGSKHQLCWKVDASTEQGQQLLAHLTEEPVAFSAVFLVPAGLAASQRVRIIAACRSQHDATTV
eukprot:1160670-Pelagomonas_calceolata.AAC.5